jgi:hypothetical protein
MDINKEAKEWAIKNQGKTLEEAFIAGFVKHGEFAEGVRLKKEQKIEKQKKDFYQELVPFVAEYGKDVVREFYDWFSQPNQSGTNISRYMQKTWDTKLRLAQWVRRNDAKPSYNNGTKIKDESPTKKYREIS